MNKSRFMALTCIIAAAAASRLVPHPPNVAPITALALFGGAHFSSKRLAFMVPLAALLLSDAVLGFYDQMWVVYGSFCMIACIGFQLRTKRTVFAIAAATLCSSILFFVVTNFGVWLFGSVYPRTAQGLATCYVAALPFFRNTLLGDCFYTGLLFGAFRLAEERWPELRHVERAT